MRSELVGEAESSGCNQGSSSIPGELGAEQDFRISGNTLVVPFRANQSMDISVSLIVARGGTASSSQPVVRHLTAKDEEVTQELPEPEEGAEIAVALQLESDQGASVTTQLELVARDGQWQRSTNLVPFTTTTAPEELPGQPPNEGIPEGRLATKEEVRATLASNGIVISDEKLFPSGKALPAQGANASANALLTADKRICFRQLFTQVGEGLGEDLFSYDGYYASKNLGIYVPGVYLGYLDASGCTPFLDIPAGYQTIQLFTIAAYDSRVIEVQTTAPPSTAEWKDLLVNFTTGTSYVSWNPTVLDAHFNITLVATEAIRRWPGWHTGTYRFYANATDNKNDTVSPHYIYVKDGDNKTMINHEFGHNFYYYNTVGSWQSWNYSLTVDPSSNCYSAYPHDIWTLEYATASMNEAAATYFAALSINYATAGDCTVYHKKYGRVDCATSSWGLPNRYIELCPESQPWAGRATEIDWLRAFWYVRTAGGVNNDNLLQWINESGPTFTYTNVYSALDARANTFGGSLNTNWDYAKWYYSVDH